MNPLVRYLPAAAFAIAFAAHAAAPAWPSKPIRMIINAPAGGATELTGRAVATKLSETLGQPIVVDNRAGAGGNIGLEAVAKAPPDGYTLLHASDAGILVSPHLYKMSFNVARDIDSVAPTGKASLFFIVRPGLPVRTLAEFVAYARANPGKLNYGSAGHGTLQHIATEMMERVANFKAVHVSYKGSQPVLVDMFAGQIDFTFDLGASIPHIKSEKVRALAVPGPTRLPMFPDIPTMIEAGTNMEISWMSGVYAPSGTPREIVTRLNREIGRIMHMPETRAQLTAMGAEPVPPMTPQAFAARNQRERERFGTIVREANIKLN